MCVCVCVYFVLWLGTAYRVLNDVPYAALMDIHFILEIPYFSIDNAHLMYNAHPNTHDANWR